MLEKLGHHSSVELLKQKMEAVKAILGAKTVEQIAEGADSSDSRVKVCF